MAREQFIDNLRLASRLLAKPKVISHEGKPSADRFTSALETADLWLSPKIVEGFNPEDFEDWPEAERSRLAAEVAQFLATAVDVPPDKPASKAVSTKARRHLERAAKIVGDRLRMEWLEAQHEMIEEAAAAAKAKGWHVERDEKKVQESLLGTYKAPRLRIITKNKEVILDPVARFGSGRKGVVDLAVMPTFETEYLITFKNGSWQIVSTHGRAHSRPFTQRTFSNTIAALSRSNAPA